MDRALECPCHLDLPPPAWPGSGSMGVSQLRLRSTPARRSRL